MIWFIMALIMCFPIGCLMIALLGIVAYCWEITLPVIAAVIIYALVAGGKNEDRR